MIIVLHIVIKQMYQEGLFSLLPRMLSNFKVSSDLGAVVSHNSNFSYVGGWDRETRSFTWPGLATAETPPGKQEERESFLSASELMKRQAMKVCLTPKPDSSINFTSMLVQERK